MASGHFQGAIKEASRLEGDSLDSFPYVSSFVPCAEMIVSVPVEELSGIRLLLGGHQLNWDSSVRGS